MDHSFPFATTLDLSPLVDFWREVATDDDNPWSALGRSILERVEGVPEFAGPLDDPARLQGLDASVEALLMAFRSPTQSGRVAALGTQTLLRFWYYGDPFPNTYYLKVSGIPFKTGRCHSLAALCC